MLFIFLFTLLNASLNNEMVLSRSLRIDVGAFPVNLFDLGIFAGLVMCVLPRGDSYFRLERAHPLFRWSIILFTGALIGGLFGAMNNGATSRQIVTTFRNLFSIPAMMVIGHRLTANARSALIYCYIVLIAGVITGIIIPFNFSEQASDMSVLRDIVSVRVVQYVANYAGLACGLLIFSMAAGTRPLLPKFVAIVLAGVCFVGNAATLSRSDWLALVFGVAAAIVAIPRYRIVTKIAYSLAVLPVLSLFLFTSIYVAGQVSGRDIFGKMQTRLISMLPGEHEGVKKNASDSRLPGTIAELQWWTSSPFIGRGFGIHDAKSIQDITLANSGFRHNVWSSTLAETGIIGFSAMAILCFGQVVLGWRMIKLRIERSFVFIGGLGVITGVYYIIHGLATMSFNQLRFAIPLAITWGVVLRCRAMQLALAREYAGYLPVAESVSRDALPPVLEDGAVPAPFVF